jgi:hypothetical protein
MFWGFPLPFVSEGWHTSMSLQFFMTELIVDLLTYFLFWFAILFSIDRFATKIKPHKVLTFTLWILTALVLCGAGLVASISDNEYYIKRPFEMNIMETGYKFVWQHTERPEQMN